MAAENENEDCAKEPEGPLGQVRADDAFQKMIEARDEPFEEFLRAAGNTLMSHVASRAKIIKPTATIQLTSIELVIGKPNGRATSTAF